MARLAARLAFRQRAATAWCALLHADHPRRKPLRPSDSAIARTNLLASSTLSGWVNNAAVFRDASLHSDGVREVLGSIALNLDLAVVGCGTAIGRFLDAGTGGAIVNVSSHQAQRAVRGALPYATAKAAIEGLTRALAVDYGPYGIRTNAAALGSITTERHEEFLARQEPAVVERIGSEAPVPPLPVDTAIVGRSWSSLRPPGSWGSPTGAPRSLPPYPGGTP